MSAEIELATSIQHKKLFNTTGLKLGKILYYLLKANQELAKKTHINEPISNGIGSKRIKTAFGKEVGRDEIYWWVYKEEKDLEALRERVKCTLAFVQLLKEDSAKLNLSVIQTYDDLVVELASFIENHQVEIEMLFYFVLWLYERDFFAPSILFTYRVWGSSRRSDRWIDLDANPTDFEFTKMIQKLTEIVCGLRNTWGLTKNYVSMEIESELYESDPVNFDPLNIPSRLIISRTANIVLKEFATFFEQVRDSLRNIKLDIDKNFAEKDLLRSEAFWKKFIIKATGPGRTESKLYDFKRSLQMWHTYGKKQLEAEIKFCKLVAAFANREGGAIIIGFTNEKWEVVGIENFENKLKSISKVIKKWIDYPKLDTIYHLQPVPFEKDGNVFLCLVIAVAQTEKVMSVRGLSGEYYYPYRDQTGIEYFSQQTLMNRKLHLKSSDNFGFMKDLENFLFDKYKY